MARRRFVLTRLTGYSNNPRARNWRGGPPTTLYYVVDRAYCDRVIEEFKNTGGSTAISRARFLARVLNARDRNG